MRRAIIAASVVALLVALYAAVGTWLAPRLVRQALEERAGRLGLVLQLGEVRTDPFNLKLTLGHLALRAGGRELARARELSADLAWSSLWTGRWRVQEITLLGPQLELVRGADGRLRWPAAPGGRAPGPESPLPPLRAESVRVEEGTVQFVDQVPGAALAGLRLLAVELRGSGWSTSADERGRYELSARVAAGGALSSAGAFSLAPRGGQGFVLHDVSLEGAHLAYAGVELTQVKLRAPRISIPSEAPFEASGSATLAPAGRLSFSGQAALRPLAADLAVQAAGLPLARANRFLPGPWGVTIAAGTASADGRLRIQGEGGRFEGALAVRDARLEQRGSGRPLLAWKALMTQQAALSWSPLRAELGEVVAQAPSARLVVEPDGRLNFAQVLQRPEESPRGDRPQIAVRRLRIEQGTLDFSDRSQENEVAVLVRELDGTVTGLRTAPGEPARVQLEGRVAQYGAARIRGSIDLAAPKSLTSIRAELRNVPLADFTPYIVRFAGYRVRSGRVSADLRYRVRDARLVGENQLSLEELQLGERVPRPGARELPLQLAVAVLADAQGRIRLDIPVSGNLNDPQFDFGGLIARALANVVGKIVSAPFRALAAAFGRGGEDFDRVLFEPGAAELTPPAEEIVGQVAEALAARPRLAVTVQGGYDPQRDAQALRQVLVRRDIAQRAGVDPQVPLDFEDRKVLQAAERLYLERVGSRLQLLSLRAGERRYARALMEQLVAATPADEQAVRTLAQARAETVRAALLKHGLAPARVSLEAPATREAGKDGVPTTLALDTGGAAAAGATHR